MKEDRLTFPLTIFGALFLILALLFFVVAYIDSGNNQGSSSGSFAFYGVIWLLIGAVDLLYYRKVYHARQNLNDPLTQGKLNDLPPLSRQLFGGLLGVAQFRDIIDGVEHKIDVVLRRVNPRLAIFVDGNEVLSRTWHFPTIKKTYEFDLQSGSLSHNLRLTIDLLFGAGKFEFYVDKELHASGRLEPFLNEKEDR